jgi:hypothetical protein
LVTAVTPANSVGIDDIETARIDECCDVGKTGRE